VRRGGAWLAWGLPVVWIADREEDGQITAATVQQVTVNHFHGGRHLHLTHGGDAAGLGLALPPGNADATEEEI
jgi:hypothetical protein